MAPDVALRVFARVKVTDGSASNRWVGVQLCHCEDPAHDGSGLIDRARGEAALDQLCPVRLDVLAADRADWPIAPARP